MNHPPQQFDLPRLLRVAQHQRAIMLCILAQIAVAAIGFFVSLPPLAASGFSLVVGVASLVFTVALARALYSMVGVIICAVMLLIPFSALALGPDVRAMMPLVTLVTLLVVNQRATKELRTAGFSVGLLGGDPAEVTARMRATGM